MNTFTPNFDEHQAYALGLLWADGWLVCPKHIKSKCLGLDVVEKDFYDFEKSLKSLGKLWYKERQRENRQLQIMARISNIELCNWLFDIGFKEKSKFSPKILISNIPKPYVKDFIRGWIDGDGCYYHNPTRSISQFTIAGSYEQDWSTFTDVLIDIGISSFKIIKKVQLQNFKNNKSSYIRITNRKDISKLHNFIYTDCKNFLSRKYLISKQITDIPKRIYFKRSP